LTIEKEEPTRLPALTVGIGASAGGLEALSQFFDAMPTASGCAFVVIQHLSPEHRSVMDKLLARRTKMAVHVATDNVTLCADTIYLIPPRKNLTLSNGSLHLLEPQRERGINLPIDLFFDSLAEDAGNRSVAIILSGTGSDGSRGIRRIKEVGGMVLVQDPKSAQFDGMPRSAMHTELNDYTMAPGALAEFLDDYAQQPIVHGAEPSMQVELDDTGEALTDIFRLLADETNIDFSYYKPATIARRMERRMGINRLSDLDAYRLLLEESSREVRTLGRELLINVTQFFRDDAAFTFLEKEVIPGLIQNAGGERDVRVWIAGCSTGEEAYSVAILLDEAFVRAGLTRRFKIFATDVDASALADATPGHYTSLIERDVSPTRLKRYFKALEDGYVLKPEIRQSIVFAEHNMISDPPFSNIDLVCCRNVLIYFQHAIQQKVISTFHFALRENGCAFFGGSESIGELDSYFEPVHRAHRIFRKRGDSTALLTAATARTGSRGFPTTLTPIDGLLKSYRSGSKNQDFEEIRELLLSEYLTPSLVVDEHGNALHVFGDAGRYLTRFPDGKVTNRVHDILPRELSVTASTAMGRARKERTAVEYSNIIVNLGDTTERTDLHARYLEAENGAGRFLIVLKPHTTEASSALALDASESMHGDQRIRDLEVQLQQEQEGRQRTSEELETTNEELQSTNEELVSANEELQSTNEELQSVNEELFTVNTEYQEKIVELSQTGDDLDKLMTFTSIGLVFVDGNCAVRKFSKQATRYFRLLASDIGRPLRYVANVFEHESLVDDIAEAMLEEEPSSKKLKTRDGDSRELVFIPHHRAASPIAAESRGVIVMITGDADAPEMPNSPNLEIVPVRLPANENAKDPA
jgi:two-component system CheB/CheR fusion protein